MLDSPTNCLFPILSPTVIAHVVSKSNIITGCSSNLKGYLNTLIGSCIYMNCIWFQEVESVHPPRLFQCSNASGNFKVEEIFEFTQVSSPIGNLSVHPPRLFQCSNASGNFKVEEIFEFTQVCRPIGN